MTESQLDTLEAKGLIRLATLRPELEYLFRHWLVQDAAYGSLLKQERRDIHGRVGEALEELYPERRGELAAVLAMHFEQAGETEKAIGYYVEAGRYGLDRNAIKEAFSAFDHASKLLPPAGPDDDDATRRRRVEIELGRTQASFSFRSGDELVADLESIVPDAERLTDHDLAARLHVFIALTKLTSGAGPEDPAVRRSLDRVTEIGEEIGDPALRAMPLALIGMRQVMAGPVRDGVKALVEALPLLDQRHDSIGAAFARGALAIGYSELGDFDLAEEAARTAREVAEKGDLIAQLDAVLASSIVEAARGRLDEAVPLAQACVSRATETGASACVMASSWVLGDVYHRQGRFEEARAALQHGADISLVVDRVVWRPTIQAWLSSSAAALGDVDAGDFDEALAMARSIGNVYGEAGILAKRGEAAAARGDLEAAIADLAASAAAFEAEGARPGLARVLRIWGDALRRAGRLEEAEPILRRSLSLFEEMGLETEAGAVRTMLTVGSPIHFD